MTIEEIHSMSKEELEAMRKILEKKERRLIRDSRRYYGFLPDICWMTEANQAKEFKTSRRTIQRLKEKLAEKGLIILEEVENGKRANLKHIIHKTLPIILRRLEEDLETGFTSSSEKKVSLSVPTNENFSYERFVVEHEDIEDLERHILCSEVNWNLLRNYSADELNYLEKTAKVSFYIECGFLVLPTHYPIFQDGQVRCSCKLAVMCPNIGKHSVIEYAHLNRLNYDESTKRIIGMFKNNPKWNIGFRVSGYSVLDVDNRNEGDRSLAKLESDFDVSFDGCLSVRCSNGKHVYCSNKHLKNNAGILGKGLDIRSEKGFIIAPGSLHKSGSVYLWDEVESLAKMPEEWFSQTTDDDIISGAANQNKKNPTTTGKVSDKDKNQPFRLPRQLTPDYVIPEGRRNDELFKWASRERGMGASAERIFNTLAFIRNNHCEKGSHPVTDAELKRMSESVADQFPPNSRRREKRSNN
jgi:hypothetical protein